MIPQQPKLNIEKVISSGKFHLLLATAPKTATQCVIKAFQKDEVSHRSFMKEKRVHSKLKHENIIKYIPDYLFQVDISQCTVIFMEYAPFGDFFNLICDYDFSNEKLIRTYFHQLIKGLNYLHQHNIAHLDLKLENILLGDDYLLKIADFDLAQQITDEYLASAGTANYRAPEILSGDCTDFKSADIYSAGICLYTLMTGAFPFMEDESNGDLFRYDTYTQRNEVFWTENQGLVAGKVNFSQAFKDLVNGMWRENPAERLTMEQVMASEWFNGPIYSNEELQNQVEKVMSSGPAMQ